MDDKSNKSEYNKYSPSIKGKVMECGVVERMKAVS